MTLEGRDFLDIPQEPDYGKQVKDSVEKVRPHVVEDGKAYRTGVQYVVQISDKYEGPTGKISPLGNVEPSNGKYQTLGFLSIVGHKTPNWRIHYHSIAEGDPFEITVGDTVEFDGITPETGSDLVNQLFQTLPNKGIKKEEGIYLSSNMNFDLVNFDNTRKDPFPPLQIDQATEQRLLDKSKDLFK